MTTQNNDERKKLVLHNADLAKKHSDLFALSQLCLGLATSPVQERLTDDDRSRIASFVHDHIDNQRCRNSFDLQAALKD
jgi:hypothetical protein